MSSQKGLDLQKIFESVVNLTETLEVYKNHNKAMISLLRNVQQKLESIEDVGGKISDIESSKEEKMVEIKSSLETLQNIMNQNQKTTEPSFNEIDSRLSLLEGKIDVLDKSVKNLTENMFPNIIGNITDLGNVIVEMRRGVVDINSKLFSPTGMIGEIELDGQQISSLLMQIPQQVTYKSQKHKDIVIKILNDLINSLKGKNLAIDELEGSFIKQIFINARTMVSEQTEGIAPRFRQAMDHLSDSFDDQAVYPISSLTPIVRNLESILNVYKSAVVQSDD